MISTGVNESEVKKVKSIKERIEKLIEHGYINEASEIIGKLESKLPADADLYSMKAVINIIRGNLAEAEADLLDGLEEDTVHFDLLFNLAYIRESEGEFQEAADLYCKALTAADNDYQKQNVSEALERLKQADSSITISDRARIVFFVKDGMNNFFEDIISGLSDTYWVRKITVTNLKQVDAGMEWADICWFEWCDELAVYASRRPMASRKKIIFRLHSYEAFTDYIEKIVWTNINKVIFVAEHIRQYVLDNNEKLDIGKTVVIPNGIDIARYSFKKRSKGFNIAYVGYINFKKGPMLLLHAFKAIHDKDCRYKLFIAGKYQEPRYKMYFDQMIEEMGLSDSVIFEGWQDDISRWLEDKDYILCTSVLEGNPVGLMEAMSRGIKPVIHNFVGARNIYPSKYIWNTIDEAVEMVTSDEYDSVEYRSFIESNYSLKSQLQSIRAILDDLVSFTGILKDVKKITAGEMQTEDPGISDLTVMIPCYDHVRQLKDDLDRGFKLGRQRKIIVDDRSDDDDTWLDIIEKNKDIYNACIVRRGTDEGTVQTKWRGFNNIETKLTAFVDDGDMLLCLDKEKALQDIGQLYDRAVLLIPRYDINYDGKEFSAGYDRDAYDGLKSLEVLRMIVSSGETMDLLSGGAAGLTEELKKHAQGKEFYIPQGRKFNVSEDFVILSRLLAANPEKEIRTAGSLVHVRRISSTSWNKSLACSKSDEEMALSYDKLSTRDRSLIQQQIALSLIAHAIGCYHCLQNGIAEMAEVIDWMKERARTMQKSYKFGVNFEIELIDYLNGRVSEEAFVHLLKLHGINLEESLDELAPELKKMRALYFDEPKEQSYFHGKTDLPLVSIIIPTYNRRDMLKRSIDQVLKQDYPNIEVIVSDNCSTDGTFELMQKEYANVSRLRYHRNEKNVGPVLNIRNALYNLAKGKYCLITSDDDYFIDSTYITRAVEALERNRNLAFVYGAYYYNDLVKGEIYRIRQNKYKTIDGTELLLNFSTPKYPYMPNINTVVFRKENAAAADIFNGDTRQMAWDLFAELRLLLTGDVGFIDEIVLVYTLHNGSASRDTSMIIDDKNVEYIDKSVQTALIDIIELENIARLIKEKGIHVDDPDVWLQSRITRYMFWRVTTSVRSGIEQYALLDLIRVRYPAVFLILVKMMKIEQGGIQ